MTGYEIASLVIQGIGLFSVAGLIFQIRQSKVEIKQAKEQLHHSIEQEKAQHEEQRRMQTVKVIYDWNAALKKETRLAEKIVEKFDENQCIKLYGYLEFYVNEEIHKMLCQMCSERCSDGKKCQGTNGKYKVSNEQLTDLRGHVTNYLNNLEIVALAWQQGIVDRAALEQQFAFLYTPGSKSALANYRKIAGGGLSYPAIEALYKKVESNQKPHVDIKEVQ